MRRGGSFTPPPKWAELCRGLPNAESHGRPTLGRGEGDQAPKGSVTGGYGTEADSVQPNGQEKITGVSVAILKKSGKL